MRRKLKRNQRKRLIKEIKDHLKTYRRENKVYESIDAMLEYIVYRNEYWKALGIYNRHNRRERREFA